MFLNSLYKIERVLSSPGELRADLKIRPDHPLYAGHFPGHPVTPGVVLTEIVKELIETRVEKRLGMVQLRQVKFLAAHDPVAVPTISVVVNWTDEPESIVQASASAGEVTYFKLSAVYRISDTVL